MACLYRHLVKKTLENELSSRILSYITATLLLTTALYSGNAVNPGVDSSEAYYFSREYMNSFYAGRENIKGNGWKQYKRWQEFWQDRLKGSDSIPSTYEIVNEIKSLRKKEKYNKTQGIEWHELGPETRPKNMLSYRSSGLGRVNCISFNPRNENIIFLGSASGGIWRSVDGGYHWSFLNGTDVLSLGITDIAIAPSNTNYIYASTGDASAFSMTHGYSLGVIRSTDGGDSWHITNLAYKLSDLKVTTQILVHPTDSRLLYVGSVNGLLRSTDGGDSWEYIKEGYYFRDLKFKPGDPSCIYAATSTPKGQTYIFRSGDAGKTWVKVKVFEKVSRIALAVTEGDPDMIAAICVDSDNGGFAGLYTSYDSGLNWTLKSKSPNILNIDIDGLGIGGQGNYDLAIAISPGDGDDIFIGGIHIWRSQDGGENWHIINHWTGSKGLPYVHADQHGLAFSPKSGELFSVNDGGIYKSTNNGSSWFDLSDGISISQIYRIGCSRDIDSLIFCGMQDNGINMFNNGEWYHVRGSDGMESLVDWNNPSYVYISTFYGDIYKSIDGGFNFENILDRNNFPEKGDWIIPLAMNPQNPKSLYACFTNLWKSEDRGEHWAPLSGFTNETPFKAMAIAESDTNVIYASRDSTLFVSKDGGKNWDTLFENPMVITYITIDNNDPDHLWVSLSGYNKNNKVFEHRNGQWINISEGLPNLPVNCIVYRNNSDNNIFCGTDAGVYYRDDRLKTWLTYGNGLPQGVVTELEIFYPSMKLRAGTFGRGLWEADIPECSLKQPDLNIFGDTEFCSGDSLIVVPSGDYENYRWSDGRTTKMNVIKDSGDYYLIVMDSSGCYARSQGINVKVHERPGKPVIIRQGDMMICDSAAEYQWYRDGHTIAGENGRYLQTNDTGVYKVEIFNEYGCSELSDPYYLYTDVKETNKDNNDPEIIPNPNNGEFRLRIANNFGDNARIIIYDPAGRIVRDKIITLQGADSYYSMQLKGLQNGVYLIKLLSGDKIITRKFVVITGGN